MKNIKDTLFKNPIFRSIGIASINILFFSQTIKSWFEKNIFNPYEIDGNKNANYALAQITAILSHLDISEKSILEIGPGGNYYLACLLLKHGANKVFVIDNENHNFFSEQEIAIYKDIYPESISDTKTINQDKIVVLRYGRNETIPLSNHSIDIIYSNAVLEHVFHPKKLIKECLRILRTGGKMMHQIDYRDHIFDQQSLFFLRIPNILFDCLFKKTGMWVNRLRHSHWLFIFESSNQLNILSDEKQTSHIVSKKLDKLTSDDFKTTSELFILEKYAD